MLPHPVYSKHLLTLEDIVSCGMQSREKDEGVPGTTAIALWEVI